MNLKPVPSGTIKFSNLLTEARYAWEMGDFTKAELLTSEASVLASLERKVQELNTNEKAVTRMTA